jgi:hypothetical protein
MFYKGTKQNMYRYLLKEPRARERANKYKTLTNLVIKRFPEAGDVDKQKLIEWIYYAIKQDRNWRWLLQHHEELQGKDYKDKKRLVKKALLEYGYNITTI